MAFIKEKIQKLLSVSFFLILLVFLDNSTQDESANQNKLIISVYYETLCGGSVHFMQNEFAKNWEPFFDYVLFELLPYGVSTTTTDENGNVQITCRHGPEECKAAIIQACAIKLLSGDLKVLYAFIQCFMKGSYIASRGAMCAKMNKISYTEIEKCANEKEGIDLLAEMGKVTPPLPWVPTVIFNHKYNHEDNKAAISNLKATLCRILKTKPDICSAQRKTEL